MSVEAILASIQSSALAEWMRNTSPAMPIVEATHALAANTAFQLKARALVGAGLNMTLFQLVTARALQVWDANGAPPRAARAAGLISVWISRCRAERRAARDRPTSEPLCRSFDSPSARGQLCGPALGS